MKKLIALVLALAMVATLGLAFAGTVDNKTTHTYDVYQIFSGTQSETSGETGLGDIAWGSGIANGATFLSALQGEDAFKKSNTNIFASATDAKGVADALGANSDKAAAFANFVVSYLSTTKVATVTGNTTSSDLPAGYYLFLDTTTIAADGNDAKNSALLQITNKTEGLVIQKKYDVPSFDKGIVEGSGLVEATDKAIGDTVTYQLTGTLPSNYADYESYKYVFHDTLSAGQAINLSSITVKADTTTLASGDYSVSYATGAKTDGTEALTFTVGINDLKTITTATITKDTVITVTYNVTITSAAVIGATGNPNEGWLEYSNNPNHTGSGTPPTTTTPHDYTLVFTYELLPTKTDSADTPNALSGAQFVLKATNGDHSGKYVQIDASTKKVTGWLDTRPTAVDTVPTSGNTGVLVSGTNGQFEVYGLDSGTFELIEIRAPKGYNLLTSAVPVVITAVIDATEATGPSLTSLKITVDGDQDTTDYKTSGILPMGVENNQGTELPSTGGIGTTIFYIIGGLLVIGAAVILVARRKAHE